MMFFLPSQQTSPTLLRRKQHLPFETPQRIPIGIQDPNANERRGGHQGGKRYILPPISETGEATVESQLASLGVQTSKKADRGKKKQKEHQVPKRSNEYHHDAVLDSADENPDQIISRRLTCLSLSNVPASFLSSSSSFPPLSSGSPLPDTLPLLLEKIRECRQQEISNRISDDGKNQGRPNTTKWERKLGRMDDRTLFEQYGVCGKLRTETGEGEKEILFLVHTIEPITLGRHRTADYTLPNAPVDVSNMHAKIWAIRTDAGETLVCLEDTSSNGLLWNNQQVHRQTIILNHGDVFKIGSQAFAYIHMAPYGRTSESQRHSQIDSLQNNGFRTIGPKSSLGSERLGGGGFRIGDYLISKRILGTGAFGAVHLAQCLRPTPSTSARTTNPIDSPARQIACKIVRRFQPTCSTSSSHNVWPRMSSKRRKLIQHKEMEKERKFWEDLKSEVEILGEVGHPNITRIEDCLYDDKRVYLMLQLVTGGDLYGYLIQKECLKPGEVKFIGYQILKALEYLHALDVSHRDVKPENILLDSSGPNPRIVLTDFGAARQASSRLKSLKGTLVYLPPEALSYARQFKGYDGKAVDCWSLGVVFYYMLSGVHPFSPNSKGINHTFANQPTDRTSSSDMEIEYGIRDRYSDNTEEDLICSNTVLKELRWEWEIGHFADHDEKMRDLLLSLLHKDPSKRLTSRRALDHEWFLVSKPELDALYQKKVADVAAWRSGRTGFESTRKREQAPFRFPMPSFSEAVASDVVGEWPTPPDSTPTPPSSNARLPITPVAPRNPRNLPDRHGVANRHIFPAASEQESPLANRNANLVPQLEFGRNPNKITQAVSVPMGVSFQRHPPTVYEVKDEDEEMADGWLVVD